MLPLPKISIVTPSFNQADFVEATLRSVLRQQYPNLEYIVIDGGSTDGSVDIIRRYSDQLHYWVSEPDIGQSAAINKGFAHATGDILAWINSDDVLYPHTLHLIGTIFARYPEIAWLTGLGSNIDAEGNLLKTMPPSGRLSPFIRSGWYHGRLLGFIRQESTFWRRDLWLRERPLDEARAYGMDFDLWQHFAEHADLVTVQYPLAAFREHPSQKTGTITPYYREIGVRMPHQARVITVPARALFDLVTLPLTPRVTYHHPTGEWRFQPGPFFQPGIR